MVITSRQNPIVARFRDAARDRRAGGPVLLDGVHLVSVALACGWPLEVVALEADLAGRAGGEVHDLSKRLVEAGVSVVHVSGRVLEALSPVRTPSGVVALAPAPASDTRAMVEPAPALVLVAVAVQDPGNLGAIVRVADAAGATGVIVTTGSADPFGWKALRGSMGSGLRLPLWAHAPPEEVLGFLRVHGLRIVAADQTGEAIFTDLDLTRPTAVLLGAEGHGLPGEVEAWAGARARIPMRDGVESLNVAVTAALLAYEARRQRQSRRATIPHGA